MSAAFIYCFSAGKTSAQISAINCGCEKRLKHSASGSKGYWDCTRKDGSTFTQWMYQRQTAGGWVDDQTNMPKGCVPKEMMNMSGGEMVDELVDRITALNALTGGTQKSTLEISTLSNDQSVFSGYLIKTFESKKEINEIVDLSKELLSKSEAREIAEDVTSFTQKKSDSSVSPYVVSIQTPSGSIYTVLGACATKNTATHYEYVEGPAIIKVQTAGSNYKNELDIAQSYYYYILTSSKDAPCPFRWNDEAVKTFARKISADKYGLD